VSARSRVPALPAAPPAAPPASRLLRRHTRAVAPPTAPAGADATAPLDILAASAAAASAPLSLAAGSGFPHVAFPSLAALALGRVSLYDSAAARGAIADGGADAAASSAATASPGVDGAAVSRVMGILSRNPTRIVATDALELLPPETPVSALLPFLRASSAHASDATHGAAIARSLGSVRAAHARAACVEKQARSVTLDRSTPCAACGRRLALVPPGGGSGGAPGAFVR
jgi:hypothetical protein